MIITEVRARSILSKSQVFDYVVNAYTGCQFSCAYCYARFMKRFSRHKEPWGEFVDVKINAAELLSREIVKKKPGSVWVSGVCDPYQPLEKRYELTRKCLQILIEHDWQVTIQTKSPLVLRDIDLLKKSDKVEVGFTVTNGDDKVRRLFEPGAPAISARIKALEELHNAGISTFAMIAPMLPGARLLPPMLAGKVDRVRLDRLNYHYADWVYRRHGITEKNSDAFFAQEAFELSAGFSKRGIECNVIC